jgi:uncharacterized repeat protein (TIGR01451 family)
LVEFALILPLFLVVSALTIDFGRLFYAYVAVANAAKEGAAYAAQSPSCVTAANCPNPNNVTWHVTNEAANLQGLNLASYTCLTPAGATVNLASSSCTWPDVYQVGTSYAFTFVTPILSQWFGSGLTLQSKATAVVLNPALPNSPGASITNEACFGALCTPQVTPYLDDNNNQQYVTGAVGQSITYQITVTNVGNQALSGLGVTDTLALGNTSPSSSSLPFGTSGCPSLPTSLAIGASWQCTYTTTAPNTNGAASLQYTNTATMTASGIQQLQAVATVEITSPQPQMSVAEYVSPYKLGGNGNSPFGTATSLNVAYNTLTGTSSATVWYEVVVSNTGTSVLTGLQVSDTNYPSALPAGTSSSTVQCPSLPLSLGPAASWICLYAETYSLGSTGPMNPITAVATASQSEVPVTSDPVTVGVSSCPSSSWQGSNLTWRVIPSLIGDGTSTANSAWSNAGFPNSQLSISGGSSAIVSQSLQAYSCVAPTTTMTASK